MLIILQPSSAPYQLFADYRQDAKDEDVRRRMRSILLVPEADKFGSN
jgi:hypothetical protein